MKLTPPQLLHKKKVDAYKHVVAIVLSHFNFGKVKTWGDIYSKEGIDPKENSNLPVSRVEAKAYLDSRLKEIESGVPATEGRISASPLPESSAQPLIQSPIISFVPCPSLPPIVLSNTPQSNVSIQPAIPETKLSAENDYGLHGSPKEKAKLYWHQKKAAKELWDKVTIAKLRAMLLLAGTGTGKTYIMGALLRRLVDISWEKGKTFGPTPYLYVTKVTVVEQTKRVLKDSFGLTVRDGVEVINIEQLRSTAGQFWVDTSTVVVNSKEEEVYKWRPMLQPAMIVLDECQSVKNEDSTQSKIITSYSELAAPVVGTVVVYVSATPFTRVSEAKSFVLNCHYEDREL